MRSKISNRVLSVLLALVMVLTVLPTMAFAAETKSDDIVILYTNDVHCGVDADKPKGSMGYANLAAYKKAMEATHNNVVLVDAGDAIQGEAIGTLSNGDYLVDIMNYVGYDFATYGNHEFDYGMDKALSLLTASKAKYLSCNFMDLRTNKTVADAYAIETYGDVKVAYVGIATPETITKSTPTYFQDENGNYIYGFCQGGDGQELYDAVQKSVDAAKKEGADYIIGLGHLGVDEQSAPWRSTDVIANTTGFDAMIDGHSHSTIEGQIVKDKEGNDVLLSSTGTKLMNIGKMTISADGKITSELVSNYTEVDAATDAHIKNIQSQFEDKLNEVVAKTEVALAVNNPTSGNRLIRSQETNLGDLCADAYRAIMKTDIAFVNGGGIRADIPEGDITYGDVIAVHPFGNTACSVEATGQEIVDALEMASRSAPDANGGFLQVSGLKYTIDTNVDSTVVLDDDKMFVEVAGARRVKNVQVLNKDNTYEPIDLDATYSLASHNYMLLSGGDGINMFMDNKVIEKDVMADNLVLITYIRDHLNGVVGEAYSDINGSGRITYEGLPFVDVPQDRYYSEPAAFAFEQGFIKGIDTTHFAPYNTLNRAMVATVLYRMEGEPAVEKTASFPDLTEGSYYETAVNWAAANDIVTGYEDGKFRPTQAVSRQEMVTMFYRYAKHCGYDVSASAELNFQDAKQVMPYAQDAMKWAVSVELVNGVTPELLKPRGLSNRAQFVTVLYRFYNNGTEVFLMSTSDIHGQLYATDYTADASASGTYHQSLTRVATYVKSMREQFENTLLMDCGDLLQGTPMTYYYCFNKPEEQDPAMKALRMMDYDMFVPGNHEFNYGLKILNSRLDYLTSESTETESQVAVSCANYLAAETNSDEQKDWATWKGYAPYELYDFDGITVAVLGIGNPNVPKWDSPENWKGIYFANPIETYKHYEAELTEKADVIVVASHSGIDSDPESDYMARLIAETNTIDLIISGHEHRYGITEVQNKDGKEIPIVSPSTKCAAVGTARITVSSISGQCSVKPEMVDIATKGADYKWAPNYEVDTELEAALKPYEEATWKDYMLKPIGNASGDFTSANLGGGPSAFVELVNKVQLWGAYDRTGENTPEDNTDDVPAMLSITAPLTSGNAENLIAKGQVMLGDMYRLYRYENWFYQITMTGKEVDTWLEYSASKVQLAEDGTVTIKGGLTYYDVINGEGFYYEIDPSKPEGDRVTMTYKGEPVADDFAFTVVLNNYRYNGGGDYIAYLNAHGCDFTPNDPDRVIYSTQYDMKQGEDKGQARNLLADYITEQGTIDPTTTFQWKILGAAE